MRDEEGRKKEASEVKQPTRQSNTTHPRQSLFQRKNELRRVASCICTICYALVMLGKDCVVDSRAHDQMGALLFTATVRCCNGAMLHTWMVGL